MVKFEYKGKIYQPADLDKKLKSLGITKDDIKILEVTETKMDKVRKDILEPVPYWEKRINVNTVLVAYNEEQKQLLMKWHGISE